MNTNQMTHHIMRIHLASWRYLALLTLPPLVLAFALLNSPASMLLFSVFFVAHYFCWRLWLDERLFTLLNNESDLEAFDAGMSTLWTLKNAGMRPLEQRWHGARQLLYKALFTVAALWIFSVGTVLILSLR